MNASSVSSNVFFMRSEVKNWLASADYDLGAAKHMLEGGRYLYTIFMCHLCIEKLLKAKVAESRQELPPRTHDLKHLLSLTTLEPTNEHERFIAVLSNLSVTTRYPDSFELALSEFSEERAKTVYKTTEEVAEWMKKSIKQ